MPTTIESTRLAMLANQQEIANLLGQIPVDHLAVQQLQAENSRLLTRIRTAQNLATASDHKARPDVERVLNQFMPRAFAHIS